MPTMFTTTRIPPVATVIEPIERPRVDAAGIGLYRTIHRNNLGELLRDLKERRISAVLVSVARCVKEESSQMAAVIREFPRIPTVALLSGAGDASAEAVLALGNCGVRTLVDVREPAGWSRLRHLLGREATRDVDRAALAILRRDLDGVALDCWAFFEALFSTQYRVSTVRHLARRLDVLPSTLMSRFFRARLPAPKRYLAFARLVRAARLFENPGLSIADVANHLDYSSPQSFGRHVKTMLHLTAGEFRHRYDGERMFRRFRQDLVLPNIDRLLVLHPLLARPGLRSVLSVQSDNDILREERPPSLSG
jgi:AraC-like DNA-binding protein